MGAEFVIAVDISSAPEANAASDTLEILMQTFTIMSKSINTFELKDADVVVRPLLVSVGSSNFAARRQAIEAGRVAMTALLPQLRLALGSTTSR